MRPGPGVESHSAVGVRVAVSRGSVVLATDVPARDVQVSATADRVVPTQVTFEAPRDWVPDHPGAPLAAFGQRVRVVSLLETAGSVAEVEFGWFLISQWAESSSGVRVTCLDLMQLPEDDPFAWPSSPPRGATLRSELQRLAGGLPVSLEVPDRPVDTTIQWGTSRTASIHDLCAAHGLAYGVKPDGYLHVWALADGSVPVATYRARDVLVDAPRVSGVRVPNRWTAVGAVGSGDDAVQVTAEAGTDVFPFEPDVYGVVRERVELASVTSQVQVDAAAREAMRAAQVRAEVRQLEIVTDSRLELGDVIGAVTDGGEHLVGRVTAYSMVLDDPAGLMRVDVEVLAW